MTASVWLARLAGVVERVWRLAQYAIDGERMNAKARVLRHELLDLRRANAEQFRADERARLLELIAQQVGALVQRQAFGHAGVLRELLAGEHAQSIEPLGHIGAQIEASAKPLGAVAQMPFAAREVLHLLAELERIGLPRFGRRVQVGEIPALGERILSCSNQGADAEQQRKDQR